MNEALDTYNRLSSAGKSNDQIKNTENYALVEVDSRTSSVGSLGDAGNNNDNEHKPRRRESGIGILEFTPTKAGQDVTPANLEFKSSKRTPGMRTQSSIHSLKGKQLVLLP